MKIETKFSPDRAYRYTLWREWELPIAVNKFCMFIGLNPSTADESKNDQTIRRCMGFAKSWGYDALCMTNLFAFRATKPSSLKKSKEPIGIENTPEKLLEHAAKASLVIAIWGRNGKFKNRDEHVKKVLLSYGIKLHHLGLNKDGTPKHPLRLAANTKPKHFL
jgi:hypothetical protein